MYEHYFLTNRVRAFFVDNVSGPDGRRGTEARVALSVRLRRVRLRTVLPPRGHPDVPHRSGSQCRRFTLPVVHANPRFFSSASEPRFTRGTISLAISITMAIAQWLQCSYAPARITSTRWRESTCPRLVHALLHVQRTELGA